MAQIFIDRPVLAWVIAILIMLAGGLSITQMQVSQYPAIAPPTIVINASYPGASAKTVEDAVVQVVEQKMSGLDGLQYMSSTSDSYGNASITLTFKTGTDPDIAQVQTQNKLQNALPMLPQVVQQQGVSVAKSARNFLMIIGLVSPDGSKNSKDLSDFLASSVQDPLSRVGGVGEVQVFGAQYAMRVWMDPAKLYQFKLTPADLKAAIQAQNAEVSGGQLGGTPAEPGQGFAATLTAQSRFTSPAQFEAILLRSDEQGGEVRLGDVARVEIGSENYGTVARYNGQQAAGLGIKLAAGANALQTAEAVHQRLEELKPFFPAGVVAVVPYETTPFVRISIESVIKTLLEAMLLVFVVMFLFLQNLRATLIPTLAIPVVLLGTFGVMAALGFSINTLTLFGLVLAIGLLVDDAIVVVENVERLMSEEGLSPKEATRKSMRQITGALVSIGLVLSAVFVPMAFFGGSAGVIYQQFSVTIVSAMALSVLVAIVFTPALCATILKPIEKGHGAGEGGLLGGFFAGFNRLFTRGSRGYEAAVGGILKRSLRFLAIYVTLVVVLAFLFMRMPTSFLPEEDQGFMFNQIMLPAGASQERTLAVLEKVERHFLENEKDNVKSIFTVAGFSFAGRGQHMGIGFVNLHDWSERTHPGQDVKSIAGRAMGAFSQIREAMVFAFVPPAVIELGTAGGFNLYLQDRAGIGHEALVAARNQFLGMAAKDPRLIGVRPNGQDDMAEFQLVIDHAKAGALGVSVAGINDTLSTAWGGAYVNDFLDRGRTKKVYVQADAGARMTPQDLDKWYVRNAKGEMVPFSAFASTTWGYGSPRLERFNGVPAMELMGQAAPGLSSGEAMAAVEELISKLPPGIGYEWSGTSYEERQSGSQATLLYALSVLIVFLCLAALYESWSVPFAVLLVVPLGVLGALLAASGRGLSNDVYFQVGLLATIGLSAKNAILIVEFAKAEMQSGKELVAATLAAVRMRLRPIIMTSLAFGFGVLPLAISTGAGSGSQHAIGTGVLGGTIAGTLLGLIFIPLFFVVVMRVFKPKPVEAIATLDIQEVKA
ncbi:MAG: efflux RND transporter permease subunit [Halothiobacillaceae bacterium]|nr:efflux RND transporter permease subunit [Halothiobacillaceae bacterium]